MLYPPELRAPLQIVSRAYGVTDRVIHIISKACAEFVATKRRYWGGVPDQASALEIPTALTQA